MVATTPVFDLPYQQGSDPPCFGPGTGCDNLISVWCDFAALVEEQLDTVDAVIGRTATAIPMAKISVFDTWGAGTTGPITFDTVVFDTDSMVDLDAGVGITPNRNGVYRIDFYGEFQTETAVNDEIRVQISIGGETEPVGLTNSIANAYTISQGLGLRGVVRASTAYNFTDTIPSPREIIAEVTLPPGTDSPFIAELEVYWQGDPL